MAHHYLKALFTDSIRKFQEKMGSRNSYERMENGSIKNNELSEQEMEFILLRDSFYMATVTEDGWPYVQHRGGPKGFVKVLSPTQLAFADYSGNRQYITLGNLQNNHRASLIFMDYPNQTRLKIAAEVSVIDNPNTLDEKIVSKNYKGKVERILVLDIIGFDWNCPQHITPRYTQEEMNLAPR